MPGWYDEFQPASLALSPSWCDIADAHLHKGDGMRGPPAEHAGRLASRVAQAPVVILRNGLLQHALGGEVKGRRAATGRVDPVYCALPVRILRTKKRIIHCAKLVVESGCSMFTTACDFF